jgi:hypothetical protein
VEVRTDCAAITNSAMLNVLPNPSSNPVSYTNDNVVLIFTRGPAVPYASVIRPQCVPGAVKRITASLFEFSHTSPSDVNVLLVGPDGKKVNLMGGAGGFEPLFDGVDLIFTDATTNLLPEMDLILSGTYHPSDYDPDVVMDYPAPAGPYSTNLSTFVGTDPSGPWTLFVYDAVALDGGVISSWGLNIEWEDNSISLRHPEILGNGTFRVEVWSPTGATNIILRSTNLTSWMPLATNVYSTVPGIYTDLQLPPSPRRFYRAVLLP